MILMIGIEKLLKDEIKKPHRFSEHNILCSVYEYLYARLFYNQNRKKNPSSILEWEAEKNDNNRER